jgi:uncharacterized protein (TIGR04255 family)
MVEIKIPKKITPDPIIDSVIELRFQTIFKKEEIISRFYNRLNSDFPFFREQQQQILIGTFKPEYLTKISIQNKDFTVSFGSNVVVFGNAGGYKGWSLFSKMIYQYTEVLVKEGLIGKIDRIGIRYVNFFKDVLLLSSNTNLKINFGNKQDYSENKNTQIRTELSKGKFGFNLVMADNVAHNSSLGSILDIDAYVDKIEAPFSEKIIQLIEEAHVEEKQLFYGLLKPEFIEKFKPEY